MIISVLSIAGLSLRIEPEPAFVHVGDRVVWRMLFVHRIPNLTLKLKWTVYFEKGSPFKVAQAHEFSGYGESSGQPKEVIIDAGTAEEPGHYKYGVRIVDAETQKTVSDDDPALIVLP